MNSAIINRLQDQYDSSNKAYKGKIMSGAKERATKRYFKNTASLERRKQTKVRHDTHRRDEQLDDRDLWLEDLHFANFLGVKDAVGVPYNNTHINEPVNICECDLHRPAEPEAEYKYEENINKIDDCVKDYSYVISYYSCPQIQRESNCVWNMNWIYEPETQTLTGYSTFKRGHEEEEAHEEESQPKRMRSDSYDYEMTRMEEGLDEVERLAEEANFTAMVAYMREQVSLAEQLALEACELYPCDCLDCRK